MENKEYIDNRIGVIELFKIIAKKRVFILIFTFFITLLAIAYVNVKTPIYEVKTLIEIGSYKVEKIRPNDNIVSIENVFLDDSIQLVKKLSTIFIDLEKNNEEKIFTITNISASKGSGNFIEITSESKSNDLAKKGINDILTYIQIEHLKTLNDAKNKNQSEIKNIDQSISNIENEKIVNLDKKIKLHQENIVNLEEQMNFVVQTLKNLNTLDSSIAALKLMEKRDISNEIIINKSTLYDLLEAKESLISIDINKLKERKSLLETLSSTHNSKNTEIVGKILMDDEPAKPKKALVIVVAFVIGFILSIFIVFFMNFIGGLREEEKGE